MRNMSLPGCPRKQMTVTSLRNKSLALRMEEAAAALRRRRLWKEKLRPRPQLRLGKESRNGRETEGCRHNVVKAGIQKSRQRQNVGMGRPGSTSLLQGWAPSERCGILA
jgi:hypothetical protein